MTEITGSAELGSPPGAAPARSKVLVIYTGGTIGMVPSDPLNPASPLRPATKERLSQFVANPLEGIAWDIGGLMTDDDQTVGPLDSSSVGPKHWILMAKAIAKAYDSYDGFVILHGTDTMAYTASALSFLLKNLGKPVIITGSQLPIYQARTDAVLNFINALTIAGYKASDLPLVPEVAICFGDVLLRGNRTTKVSTSRWQGFDSPNYAHLGAIGERIAINKDLLLQPPDEKSPFFASEYLEEAVATIWLYPGVSPPILRQMLELDVKGFVLRSFGTGNAPEEPEFLEVIRNAIESGKKIIVNTTQCVEGTVEMGLYAASTGLLTAGAVSGTNLTPEAALTKLMWLLAQEAPDEVLVQMQIAQRGEQSTSIFDVRFGPAGQQSSPVEIARLSQRPPGQFQAKELQRGVLRLENVGIEGLDEGETLQIAAFVNLPTANSTTSTTIPQFAGFASGTYNGAAQTTLLLEVTSTIAQLYETGRPINLTLLPPAGRKFWIRGAYITLVCS